MKSIIDFLICMCLTVSSLTPFSPLIYKAYLNTNETVSTSDEYFGNDVVIVEEETQSTESEYEVIASNFITLDFYGYCTLDIPLSHFKVNDSSTNIYKQLDYKDNKTRLYMSYITGMSEDTDISGYIAKELAGVNTTTNSSVIEEYNGVTWVKITADKQEDDCTVYIWYTTNKNKDSAFWVKAKVASSSDDQSFLDIMTQMFKKYYLYAVSGTLFDTPDSGYYENNKTDDTKADTSDYEANQDDNTVFKTRGGYVAGADISDNWKNLEIILDGNKFSLPSTLSKFESAGFYINDSFVESDVDTLVYPNQTLDVYLRNSNGTQIKVVFYNDNATTSKQAKDCSIVQMEIDASKYIDVVSTPDNETYNGESSNDEMAAKHAKDNYNHELILAGGVTWGVYTDDLLEMYGSNTCNKGWYDGTTQELIWTSGDNSMTIRTGVVSKILYVKLSCRSDI